MRTRKLKHNRDVSEILSGRDPKYDIDSRQIVGEQSLEAKIREQVNHAARCRESLAKVRQCKTNLESATEHNVLTKRSMSFEPTRTTRKAA
jgi:hypothetical protein